MRIFRFICILYGWSLALVLPVNAEIILDPIVKVGTPGSSLAEDVVVPIKRGRVGLHSNMSSIQNSLMNNIPVAVVDDGRPGGIAQVRGLGASSEDVDVQAFGISLNPPQGGGFDLSVFPQFLWAGYHFQNGPSLNALNVSATAGTLSLLPWSQEALLERGGYASGFAGFFSTIGSQQIFVNSKVSGLFAATAGYSSLKNRGPSGGLSARWSSSFYSGLVHVLVSDLESDSSGSVEFQTPGALLKKSRLIPVVQNNFQLSPNQFFMNSVFYDLGRLFYIDPNQNFKTAIQSTQWGTENSFNSHKIWKIGSSYKHIDFRSGAGLSTQEVGLSQDQVNLQVSHDVHLGLWLLSPSVQSGWLTGYGWVPGFSFGVRRRLGLVEVLESSVKEAEVALYSRVSFSQRLPSLLDRYSPVNEFGFQGNAGLRPEYDWTGILGWDAQSKVFDVNIEGYLQYRRDARVLTSTTTINFGDGYVISLGMRSRYRMFSWLEISSFSSFSNSQLLSLGRSFPYLSSVSSVFGSSIHMSRQVDWVSSFRLYGDRFFDLASADRLPAYGVLDTGFAWTAAKGLTLSLRVENVFDRSIEVIRGYPIERNISFLVYGAI